MRACKETVLVVSPAAKVTESGVMAVKSVPEVAVPPTVKFTVRGKN